MPLLWPSRRFVWNANPQGFLPAPVGAVCVNDRTGQLYQKVAGGSTQYGWYRMPSYDLTDGQHIGIFARGAGTATVASSAGLGPGAFSASTQTAQIFGAPLTENWMQGYTSGALGNSVLMAPASAISQLPMALDQDLTTAVDCEVRHLIFTTARPRSISSVTTLPDQRIWANLLCQGNTITAGGTLVNSANMFTAWASSLTVSPGLFGLAVRYDPVAGDTGFTAVVCNNNGAVYTQQTSPMLSAPAIAANTRYVIRIRYVQADPAFANAPSAYFSVNDTAETRMGTNVGPASAANSQATWAAYVSTTATVAAAKSIGWSSTRMIIGANY